jgi:hypothetical protein
MELTQAKATASFITRNLKVTVTVLLMVVPVTLLVFNWRYNGIVEEYKLRIDYYETQLNDLRKQNAALENKSMGFKELITTENEIDFSNLKSN